ncbi:dihydroorotase [Athalassotoga saccharophila]|uniref:dihydroorotase n=1 Tax=Athalassotoga saccharophila TaxID=1441386 RepID=UPI00137AAEDB|nr:dihydroorotase [Athalassotoga saccharophila]BBJ27330.1 dihydroorotase [Athalassotoga saccharophila]
MIFESAKIFDGERFYSGEISFEKTFVQREGDRLDLGDVWILPGLVDTHAHFRDPGQTKREDLFSGAMAAFHGGITTAFAMPNTTPAIDSETMVIYLKEKAKKTNLDLKIVGAITKNRDGKELSEMLRMARAGVVGFSDDGNFLDDAGLARHAMEYAHELGLPIISHCQDKYLGKGHMREGWFSTLYGISGIPDVAESISVAREIELSYLTKAHIHIAHVSTARSVNLIRQAKKDGINVTCDVCIHHLVFKDEDLYDYDTYKKINPPFPTSHDQRALYEGIEDDTIDAIITDHAPYLNEEKEVEFQSAPFGIIGFETLLNEIIIVSKNGLKIEKLLKKVSSDPAKIYGLEVGRIKEGLPANFVIFDPEGEWHVSKETLMSRSSNTPFLGKRLKGRVISTFVEGRQVFGDVEKIGKGILHLA